MGFTPWAALPSDPEFRGGACRLPRGDRALEDALLRASQDAGPVTLTRLVTIAYPNCTPTAEQRKRLARAFDALLRMGALTFRHQGRALEAWNDLYNLYMGRTVLVPKGRKAGGADTPGVRKRALAVTFRVGSRYHDKPALKRLFLEDALVRYHSGIASAKTKTQRQSFERVADELAAELAKLVGPSELAADWRAWKPATENRRAARKFLLDYLGR